MKTKQTQTRSETMRKYRTYQVIDERTDTAIETHKTRTAAEASMMQKSKEAGAGYWIVKGQA